MSEFQTALDIAQIATAAAAGVAAGVAVWQIRMTKQQMDNSLRPWIGVAAEGLKAESTVKCFFNYRNYGQLPALRVSCRTLVSNLVFPKEEMVKRGLVIYDYHTLMPQEAKHQTINAPDDPKYTTLYREGKPAFFGVLITYEYANKKKGEYGVLIELDTNHLRLV